jgi:beta-phosphoglucomutase
VTQGGVLQTRATAALWDVDGTLVDTAELHFQAWADLARDRGLPFTREDFAATFGRRNPEIIRQLFGARRTDAEVAELGEHKEVRYRAAAGRGVALLPGVRALLEGLRGAGFRQAVGSSAPRANLDLILRLTETGGFFDAVVAMEDTQRGKPDPQVFLLAAERLGVLPARCVVLEDAVAGVEAARAGGMRCVAVTFVGHHPAPRLRAAGADLVVETLEAVTAEQLRGLVSGG